MTYRFRSIYLTNNEEVFSIDDCVVHLLPNGLAHLHFIAVDWSSIDMTIADLDGVSNGPDDFIFVSL